MPIQIQVEKEILKPEVVYDCPHCSDPLSLESGDEYVCMNCDYSVDADDVETEASAEIEIYRGNKFDDLIKLIENL